MNPIEHNRIHSLDFLRGLAVLLVLFRHLPNRDTSGVLHFVQTIGWTGVDLFFVLSGFLISGIAFQGFRPLWKARREAVLVASRPENLAFVLSHIRHRNAGNRFVDR